MDFLFQFYKSPVSLKLDISGIIQVGFLRENAARQSRVQINRISSEPLPQMTARFYMYEIFGIDIHRKSQLDGLSFR